MFIYSIHIIEKAVCQNSVIEWLFFLHTSYILEVDDDLFANSLQRGLKTNKVTTTEKCFLK